MFQYAVVKTIAEEKGIPFRYYRIPTPLVNSTDSMKGYELDTIFPIPADEKVTNTRFCTEQYNEPPSEERAHPGYKQRLFEAIHENQIVSGLFATPELIEHNLSHVRRWFTFPETSVSKAQNFLQQTITPGKKSCAVHFRVGCDYFSLGYRLHSSYWIKAAKEVLRRYPDTHFICVYDKRSNAVDKFVKQFQATEYHSSLVDDMALLAQTDMNIVCNSTFSIMGALLNPENILTICPSIYPPLDADTAKTTYSTHWIRIPDTRRDLLSKYALMLRNAIKRILCICRLRQP